MKRREERETHRDSRICFRDGEKNQDVAHSREYRRDPEEPPPRDTADGDVSGHYWAECGASERSYDE